MLTPNDKYKKIPVSLGFSISCRANLEVPENYTKEDLNDLAQQIAYNLNCESNVKLEKFSIDEYWIVDDSEYEEVDDTRHTID